MFSGIIDAVGRVRSCRIHSGGAVLEVTAPGYWTGLQEGASVAIDGACLTLTRTSGDTAGFDVVTETLERTTLRHLRSGDRVNLQKALAMGQRVDGHFVQGHVDAVGTITNVEQSPTQSKWWFSVDAEAAAFITPKGSVAIDGISLTVVDVRDGLFSTALIPTTIRDTTLATKAVGALVNVETDILARTLVAQLRSMGQAPQEAVGSLTLDDLRRHGFA